MFCVVFLMSVLCFCNSFIVVALLSVSFVVSRYSTDTNMILMLNWVPFLLLECTPVWCCFISVILNSVRFTYCYRFGAKFCLIMSSDGSLLSF